MDSFIISLNLASIVGIIIVEVFLLQLIKQESIFDEFKKLSFAIIGYLSILAIIINLVFGLIFWSKNQLQIGSYNFLFILVWLFFLTSLFYILKVNR